jgi:hypothetical protein
MNYYLVEPEVAGGLGKGTKMDRSTHPPTVSRLHYVLDGWLGDEILQTFPCFIVTRGLRNIINSIQPTGIEFGEVEVSKSRQFDDLYPGRRLPEFVWLQIIGTAGKDDFGLSNDCRLVVSDRALAALRARSLNHSEVTPYAG